MLKFADDANVFSDISLEKVEIYNQILINCINGQKIAKCCLMLKGVNVYILAIKILM